MTNTPPPPERIYYWLDSQLSIARFYGGISYQGNQYLIAYNEKDMPLVRKDVLKREDKARKAAAKAEKAPVKRHARPHKATQTIQAQAR